MSRPSTAQSLFDHHRSQLPAMIWLYGWVITLGCDDEPATNLDELSAGMSAGMSSGAGADDKAGELAGMSAGENGGMSAGDHVEPPEVCLDDQSYLSEVAWW